MATFYVGQRVRILWSRNWPELAGQEGRIVGRVSHGPFDWFDNESAARFCQWDVAPDVWGSPLSPDPDPSGRLGIFSPNSSQLEPILPQGHRSCDEDFKRDLDRLLERQGVSA